jgi:parallel beta-helix repeat protein
MRKFFIKKSLVLLFALACCYTAFSTNYYFSTSAGDDSRTPLQAQDRATPWKTISKLNVFFPNLKPGDSVLFKRGETYMGGIIISSSGSATSPIVIATYGNGAKPIITGLVNLSNLTSLGNGVYESSTTLSMATENMVLVNDSVKPMGRYPNANDVNKGYLFYQSHSGTTSITSNQISGIPNFVGAELVIRFNRFYTDRCVITKQTSTSISYTAQSGSTAVDGFGFFFQNSPNTLDQFGEWYYNPSTHKLRVFLRSLSNNKVKASDIDTLIKASRSSYITLDNLSIQGANTYGVSVYDGSNFTIQNCDILYSGRDAVCIAATSKFKITGCSVDYSNSRGINCYQTNTTAPTITDNTVRNTGIFPGMGWKKANDGVFVGIEAGTDNSVIQNNKVLNTGFIGIRFYGDNTIVKNNYVDTFCFNKDDGGGIYTWNGTNVTHTGMIVQNNVVLNGVGAPDGTNSTNPEAQGIYLDDYSNGVKIAGNTVANCRKGIFIHNGRNIIIRNNTVYNNEYSFRTQFDAGPGITGCQVIKNIFFAKSDTQLCSYLTSTANDINNIGTFDSNYYCRPIFEPDGVSTTNSLAGGIMKICTPSSIYYSLDRWKATYAKDVNSHKTTTTVSDTDKIDFKYNETNTSATIYLSGKWLGVNGKSYSGNIILAPYSSIILINGTNSLKSESSYSNNNASTTLPGTKFMLKTQPNPSATYFNVTITGADKEPFLVRITDMSGNLLVTRSGLQVHIFQFGENFKSGTYIIEAIQGTKKAQQKVIKLPG